MFYLCTSGRTQPLKPNSDHYIKFTKEKTSIFKPKNPKAYYSSIGNAEMDAVSFQAILCTLSDELFESTNIGNFLGQVYKRRAFSSYCSKLALWISWLHSCATAATGRLRDDLIFALET